MTLPDAQYILQLAEIQCPELAAHLKNIPTEAQKRHRDKVIKWKRANAKLLRKMGKSIHTSEVFGRIGGQA